MHRGADIIQRMTGGSALGWYTGRDSPNTHRLVADDGGCLRQRLLRRRPAVLDEGARTDGSVVPQLVVPYTLDCNDMRFALPPGLQPRRAVLSVHEGQLLTLFAEGDPLATTPQDDEHRHALPPAGRRAASRCSASSTTCAPRQRVGVPAHRHRPPLGARHPPLHRTDRHALLTLDQLNAAAGCPKRLQQMLDGLYEHTPWIAAAKRLAQRPSSLAGPDKHAMAQARPKAATPSWPDPRPPRAGGQGHGAPKTLTAESTNEQAKAGLTACTPESSSASSSSTRLQRFGFPFIPGVRGRAARA